MSPPLRELDRVHVEDGDSPLDVFRHPYAYAAWRDSDLQAAA
jgi:hypothetical protein